MHNTSVGLTPNLLLLCNCSEELQLPPELKAYLDEMEAHGSGSHGGWVHSHIADRLASEDLAE